MTNDSTTDDTFAQFLDFGAGVLSLVFLSCSVIWGLVAQDRVLLDARRRILAQAVHRTTAVASVVFLLVHIGVKLALDHTTWVAAVLPFGLLATEDEAFGGRAVLIGFGTLASMLMIFVSVTGALRNRFASPAPAAARWRAMHMLAYPAWCLALVHGLYAGRSAKPLFTVLYALSLLGVMAALALRAAPAPVKRRVADRVTGLFGTEERWVREEPSEDRRSGAADTGDTSTLPGRARSAAPGQRATAPYEPYYATAAPLHEPPERPGHGFAAAYRAVSTPFAPSAPVGPPVPFPAPTPTPYADTGGSTSGNWPIPSPPPVGEAPQSVYDPLNDTGHTIPVYGNTGGSGYGSSDVYDTRETNAVYETYYPDDTYNSGPATEPNPGAPTFGMPSSAHDFGAPDSGEPWNTPSGGFE